MTLHLLPWLLISGGILLLIGLIGLVRMLWACAMGGLAMMALFAIFLDPDAFGDSSKRRR